MANTRLLVEQLLMSLKPGHVKHLEFVRKGRGVDTAETAKIMHIMHNTRAHCKIASSMQSKLQTYTHYMNNTILLVLKGRCIKYCKQNTVS